MKRNRIVRTIYAAVLITALNICFTAQGSGQIRNNNTFRSPFRYVIVNDTLDPKIDKLDVDRRFVEVLMDKQSFSKKNLRLLFQMIAKQYPKPRTLTVNVFTDLTDMETPEEREEPKFSDVEGDPYVGDHSVFIRNDKTMFFYIYFANGLFEEVLVKE